MQMQWVMQAARIKDKVHIKLWSNGSVYVYKYMVL
jgi:hypothetical protein